MNPRARHRLLTTLLLALLLPLQGLTAVSAAAVECHATAHIGAGSHECPQHAPKHAGSRCHHGCAGCCSFAAALTPAIWQAPRFAAPLPALPVLRRSFDVALERLDRPPRMILT